MPKGESEQRNCINYWW